MYVSVSPMGFAGDLPANMPCFDDDACQEGLHCCSLGIPGVMDICMTPGDCATTIMKIGCEQGGGSWSGGGCHYPSPEIPIPPPDPVTPGGGGRPAGPGPSIPGRVPPPPPPPPAQKVEPGKKLLGVDPLILGAGAVVLGVVGLAVMKKKKKKGGPR